ncbi:AAA family ATPase [Candidatus Woesearchaeota archaeon]|nr:AAA family ATPase [Candidatus Woesearchaeota archaeon]
MSFYVIIRGPLGCGKTTVSKILCRVLNAEYVSFDNVLEDNGLDKENYAFTAEDFIKANAIVLDSAQKWLNENKIVVFDGCFYFKEQIKHLEENLSGKGYTFTLKCSLNTCIKRDSSRAKVYGEQAAKEVYLLVSKFDYGIIINTEDKTEKAAANEILSHLPER